MNIDSIDLIVTGGTGLIGRWLLATLTARGHHVLALVRNASRRTDELRAFVQSHGGDPSRLEVLEGDVETPSLGLSHTFPNLRAVYHLAARFAFGLSPADARRSNVDGALHVARWTAAQPSRPRLVFLGGYRMTRPDPALHALGDGISDATREALYRSRGAYEASKHEAYVRVKRFVQTHDVPWTVVHPSGVIGDSRTGETTQTVGLGELVQRLSQRELPALVGRRDTFVPLVTVDYLAAFLASVIDRRETVGQELVVLDPNTPALPLLMQHIAKHLDVPAPRWTLPRWLVTSLPLRWTGVDPESLAFVSSDRYDTASAEAHARAAGLAQPDILESVERWTGYLVATRFLGRQPYGDTRSVAGST